jgi:NAD(P)-dependent dehydrogenase (short-subunit alcohol dehydrogenase family)
MGYFDERANVAGKVAAVVGGAAGVGAAVTMALANAGVDIAFCDINAEAVDATRAEVERLGRRVTGRVTDACDPAQLTEFYDAFDDDFDRLDVLVNIVGGVQQRRFTDATVEQWTADIHRNLVWAMGSMSLAIPRIIRGGRGGSIISFTTIEAHRGAAGYAAYAGAKAGLVNFSRALAVELGPERIRVNLVAPDTTPSESISRAMTPEALRRLGTTPEGLAQAFASYIPMVTPPPVEVLGDAVLFLASDLSSWITGTTLHVDGGTWAASGFLRWPGEYVWGPTPPLKLFRDSASG